MTTRDQANPLDALRAKIESYLRQKGLAYEVRPTGSYVIRHESTAVFIEPRVWNDTQTVVRIFAPVAVEVTRITPELTKFLATENGRVPPTCG